MSGTVLGPLTTAWSPPDSCTVYVPECVGAKCTKAYRAQQCVGPQAWGSDNAECWPPVTVSTPKPPFQGWGYYSPGLVCPTGYTTACTAEYGGTSEWNMQFTLAPGETAVGCCPEGLSCTNRKNVNLCAASASIGTTIAVPTGVCSGPALEITGIAQATFPDTITTTITNKAGPTSTVQTVTREMLLMAPMIQINFKSSDLASAPSPPTAPTTADPATGTNTDADADADADAGSDANKSDANGSDANKSDANRSGSDDSSAGSANNDDSRGGGLSTGAVAGVGVGAALGGILLATVFGWLLWRRARRARRGSEVASTAAAGPIPGLSGLHEADNARGAWQGQVYKPEAPYYHYPQDAGRHSTPPVELENQAAAAELSAVSSVPSYARWTSRR